MRQNSALRFLLIGYVPVNLLSQKREVGGWTSTEMSVPPTLLCVARNFVGLEKSGSEKSELYGPLRHLMQAGSS
jgi:hypothetical protein